uniref:Uncharacterized protein n=1 Tax=Rhizophora mucronata TaxID=61149 RepID=A0A2P2INH8_RHIMU
MLMQLETFVLCKIKHKPEQKSKMIKLEQPREDSASTSTLTSAGSDEVHSHEEAVSLPSMTTASNALFTFVLPS